MQRFLLVASLVMFVVGLGTGCGTIVTGVERQLKGKDTKIAELKKKHTAELKRLKGEHADEIAYYQDFENGYLEMKKAVSRLVYKIYEDLDFRVATPMQRCESLRYLRDRAGPCGRKEAERGYGHRFMASLLSDKIEDMAEILCGVSRYFKGDLEIRNFGVICR